MPAATSHNLLRLRQAAIATGVLAVFPLCHSFTPLLLRDAVPLCPFRAITGQPCPLCGATRAIALATHGRFRDAFHMNPAWPAFAAIMVVTAVMLIVDAITAHQRTRRLVDAASRRWLWILAILCIYGLGRIVFLH